MKKTILLLCGGGGSEHEISKISANYIKEQLSSFHIIQVEIKKDGWFELASNRQVWLTPGPVLQSKDTRFAINYAIPCIHGTPGETGEIQPLLESFNIPYFGCDSWTSSTLFNKVTTKLWCDQVGIPNTPYLFLTNQNPASLNKVKDFFKTHGAVFIKAASQGSSVGCFTTNDIAQLDNLVSKAFTFSDHVLIEKKIKARELEVAAYEYKNIWHFSKPGEILLNQDEFYDFDQKYSKDSKTATVVEPQGLDPIILDQIHIISKLAQDTFKLRHLSRIDFFLDEKNTLYLNEINTFPGMTPISMFPKMLEHNGHKFKDYITSHIQ